MWFEKLITAVLCKYIVFKKVFIGVGDNKTHCESMKCGKTLSITITILSLSLFEIQSKAPIICFQIKCLKF